MKKDRIRELKTTDNIPSLDKEITEEMIDCSDWSKSGEENWILTHQAITIAKKAIAKQKEEFSRMTTRDPTPPGEKWRDEMKRLSFSVPVVDEGRIEPTFNADCLYLKWAIEITKKALAKQRTPTKSELYDFLVKYTKLIEAKKIDVLTKSDKLINSFLKKYD
ncbi:MAG: hypothetical protein GY870_05575 [archaeon]|nr:hypothetical protein [archaeon]